MVKRKKSEKKSPKKSTGSTGSTSKSRSKSGDKSDSLPPDPHADKLEAAAGQSGSTNPRQGQTY